MFAVGEIMRVAVGEEANLGEEAEFGKREIAVFCKIGEVFAKSGLR